jgi:cell division septation protein DedD
VGKSLKERTFYTINLDVKRIAILVSILILLLVYSFMLGHTLGKKKAEKEIALENSEASTPLSTEDEFSKSPPPEKVSKRIPGNKPPEISKSEVAEPTTEESVETDIPETPEIPESKPKKKKDRILNREPKEPREPTPKRGNDSEDEPDLYSLQLGAFSSKEQALKFKENLLTENKRFKKLRPYIMKNGDLYTVRMGRSLQKEDMERERNNLGSDFKKDVLIVKIKQN